MTSVSPPRTAMLTTSLTRWRRWVILAMLLSLHVGLISEPGGYFQRSWLMVHFGLFLLWQPFVSTARELNVFATLLFFTITCVAIYSLSGWMMMTWVAILIGIMGGKVFTLQAARRGRFYLVAVFYLFTILLLWAVPVLLLEIKSLPECSCPMTPRTKPRLRSLISSIACLSFNLSWCWCLAASPRCA
jgi:hypothetical protein